MKFRILLAVVLVALSATVLAACGGTSKADYQSKVNKVMKQANKDLGANNSFQKKADYDKAAKTLDGIASNLDGITPPSDIKKEHKDLIATLHGMAAHMKAIGPELEAVQKNPSSTGKLMADAKKLQDDTKQLTTLQKAFEKKGYKFQGVTSKK